MNVSLSHPMGEGKELAWFQPHSLIPYGMEAVRRAVIDVGTNSVKLLVADLLNAQEVQPVWEKSKQTRLGRGFYQTHELQPSAISETTKAVVEFASVAREYQSESIRIIATSAVREAKNAKELTDAIGNALGLNVEILSGDEEANLVFQGVTTDPLLRNKSLLLLDVGGGSTEFILGDQQRKQYSASVALGSVRLIETIPHSNPPRPEELRACRQWVTQFLREQVCPQLEPILAEYRKSTDSPGLIGTGGTATILARMESHLDGYDRAQIENTRISYERAKWHAEKLWGLPIEKRKSIVGLPSNRADVILGGVVIYQAVMEILKFSELRISTRGLRFAAVLT